MWRRLVAVLVLTACESQYGAYLVVQSDVEIDRVELYFGTPISSSGTGSGDQFATPSFGQQSGIVFDRAFDAADIAMNPAALGTTYYVPATDANAKLGAYVVAVGFSGDKPIGIAEYFDFAVPSDEVHEYVLELEPWAQQAAERWGRAPGCIAWKRTRGDHESIAAVVHADNLDCDDLDRSLDCNDLCPTGAPLCDVDTTLCLSPCAVGCSAGGSCVPSTCLPPTACDAACTTSGNLVDHLECGSDTATHTEINVSTLAGQMCAQTLLFSPPLDLDLPPQCLSPRILFTDAAPSDIAFAISEIPQNPQCMLALDQSANFAFTTTVHLLISFAQQDASKPRRTFIIAISPRVISSSDSCDPTAYDVTLGGEIYGCAP